ncbi:hypothetical protein GQ53DRAFT_46987 [Thozetella sp. PMI_491]|nr:hypothetical protein GQ53DRAFT_46987 [Thozetella sp. PMI_491]
MLFQIENLWCCCPPVSLPRPFSRLGKCLCCDPVLMTTVRGLGPTRVVCPRSVLARTAIASIHCYRLALAPSPLTSRLRSHRTIQPANPSPSPMQRHALPGLIRFGEGQSCSSKECVRPLPPVQPFPKNASAMPKSRPALARLPARFAERCNLLSPLSRLVCKSSSFCASAPLCQGMTSSSSPPRIPFGGARSDLCKTR